MKKLVFITGTRADFGKLKSLIKITQESDKFEVHIFATRMHLNSKYGKTVNEIYKSNFRNIYEFVNHNSITTMDKILSKTINGLSDYILDLQPDLIIVHGDRVETMAGAIVGSLNNILVAHIEGGEISGTIDELIRHSVSKMAHIHFVSNQIAKNRLIQMGELESSISIIGSPDLDILLSKDLTSIEQVKDYYEIPFKKEYNIVLFHSVTTELKKWEDYTNNLVDALIESNKNYIVIYPNNDIGSEIILKQYQRLSENKRFKIYTSLRFEYFIVLLKYSKFIIGNSSSGIYEAPYLGISSINIGTRQNNRVKFKSIINSSYQKKDIINSIKKIDNLKELIEPEINYFGDGNSDKLFYKILNNKQTWQINCQKQFKTIKDYVK
jgi:UDP-N-acetylglucosamine 2-epimerase (hydrolysing)